MVHNSKEVLAHWDDPNVESMYDKYLLDLEIRLINSRLLPGAKILDAGCGEGEGTLIYSKVKNSFIHGMDFSDTRLEKARERLKDCPNVFLYKVDFLNTSFLFDKYDFVICQRFLINLMEWELQKKVILFLITLLNPGGKLILLEGSKWGVEELNIFRGLLGLEPLEIKWHNLFFDDEQLESFMSSNQMTMTYKDGLGEYFLLTRGVRPVFDKDLSWGTTFNCASSTDDMKKALKLGYRYSRLVLWEFQSK